jgi:hypothetical protein
VQFVVDFWNNAVNAGQGVHERPMGGGREDEEERKKTMSHRKRVTIEESRG